MTNEGEAVPAARISKRVAVPPRRRPLHPSRNFPPTIVGGYLLC